MKYTILLTQTNGNFEATVAGLPKCSVTAKTREEALTSIRELISKFIGRSEIIYLDVPVQPISGKLRNEAPWEWFGAFKNDQTWEELFDEIENLRKTK